MFLILLSLSLLTSCSWLRPEPEVVTIKEFVNRDIPIVNRPKALSLSDISFYVVTEENLEEFKERFAKENGDVVYYAISVRDYEKLSLNIADIQRYIEQQKQIIIYYEESVSRD